MGEDRAERVLGAVRDGWHGLAGGDASACPGCPVCSLTRRAGGTDPVASAHLRAAADHLTAA
ncbi:hypothetical protein, partial [Aquipuribacter hungaricus]|uniref:hypothetical protein n=1 Tax=Aquipuribacter hungaricus TaxID=545624 RepID=UPI0030EF0695